MSKLNDKVAAITGGNWHWPGDSSCKSSDDLFGRTLLAEVDKLRAEPAAFARRSKTTAGILLSSPRETQRQL
jgi:hypothetical protein